MVRIIIVSAHEWRKDMQIRVASLHLKQAFDRVTPTPAMALLREQVEGRNIVSFGWITVDEVGLGQVHQARMERESYLCSTWWCSTG